MFIKYDDESIRYTGRWDLGDKDSATTTAPGSMVEVAFKGKAAVLHFSMEMNMYPYPHIWIIVDDGTKIESVVNHVIRVEATEACNHVVKVIYKSAVEIQPRWYRPLIGKIRFLGADVEERACLPEDNRKIIEFIGDSITEGVAIDMAYTQEQYGQFNRPNQDDATATYAYLTAMNLGRKPVIMGYGAVGVTKSGTGSVPRASEAYPYNFEGSLYQSCNPELIVINHGANDCKATSEEFVQGYLELLQVVRKRNPWSKIAVVTSFGGPHLDFLKEPLKTLIEKFNHEQQDQIYFIDSADWRERGPVHPSREEHAALAEHLTRALQDILE